MDVRDSIPKLLLFGAIMKPARCSHSPCIVFISLIACMKTKIIIMPAQGLRMRYANRNKLTLR